MTAIQLHSLGKAYGAAEVMRDVNLSIEPGEFVVLLGPSGCGKSTILRMVAGLESVSSGEIRIGDRVVNDLPPGDREIALVFQNYALYPHMTAFENIAFGLRRLKVPKPEIEERVAKVSEILGITPLLQRRPRQMSGGQQQRIAIARAMIKQPKVFLFDEPLSNLDAKLRDQMRIELKKLHRMQTATTVFVTHDQLEAMTLADRIVIMNAGIIEQVGTPEEIYYSPRTLFVAKFVGTPNINLFPMNVDSAADGLRLRSEGFSIPLGSQWNATVSKGQKLIAAYRPKDFVLAKPDTPDVLAMTVELTEMMGDETLIQGTLGGQQIQVLVPYSSQIKEGQTAHLTLRDDRLKLFDEKTGLAMMLPSDQRHSL
ncbi:ABC transporter ATP-binding protein [Nitratireductor sp. GCM10026969]|uniref:ABC transporter ATP-binding protein n=1 Tax=Nitratireductor sp. GCM10026969 TaxID=3252645 RepID=UPI00360B1822